jgi:hypothetical protein
MVGRIQSYEDLQTERERLEMQIQNQKNIIRHDLDELKIEFKKEIKPALDAAQFIRKIATPENRRETIKQIGATLLIELAVRKMLQRSNLLLQVILPALTRSYTQHFIKKISIKNSFK